MSSYLLDTHVLLWWLKNSEKLGEICKQEISNPENEIYVSPILLWEISIKKTIGKLEAPEKLASICEKKGFTALDVTVFDGESIEKLPLLHKDPFDRMLIVQAQNNHLSIITNDEEIMKYKVNTLKAKNYSSLG